MSGTNQKKKKKKVTLFLDKWNLCSKRLGITFLCLSGFDEFLECTSIDKISSSISHISMNQFFHCDDNCFYFAPLKLHNQIQRWNIGKSMKHRGQFCVMRHRKGSSSIYCFSPQLTIVPNIWKFVFEIFGPNTHYKNAPDQNEVRSRNGAYKESDLQARGSRVLLM